LIDWVALGFNALWVLGAAILLAAFSYLRWLADESGRPLRDLTSTRSWTITFTAGVLLLCAGIAGGIVERWWERAIWIALAAASAYRMALAMAVGRAANRHEP
jgi:hypothetical protein